MGRVNIGIGRVGLVWRDWDGSGRVRGLISVDYFPRVPEGKCNPGSVIYAEAASVCELRARPAFHTPPSKQDYYISEKMCCSGVEKYGSGCSGDSFIVIHKYGRVLEADYPNIYSEIQCVLCP